MIDNFVYTYEGRRTRGELEANFLIVNDEFSKLVFDSVELIAYPRVCMNEEKLAPTANRRYAAHNSPISMDKSRF